MLVFSSGHLHVACAKTLFSEMFFEVGFFFETVVKREFTALNSIIISAEIIVVPRTVRTAED